MSELRAQQNMWIAVEQIEFNASCFAFCDITTSNFEAKLG